MRSKKLSLAISALVMSAGAQAELFDARAMGRGGVGLTMGEYNQATTNPALINQYDDNDEFSFALNGGATASDAHGVIDDVDTVQEDLDALEACGQTSPGTCSTADLKASLADLDEKMLQLGAGGAVMIGIPNTSLPLALVARGSAEAGVLFNYDTGDDTVLDNIANGTATQDDLNSTLEASAVGLMEAGLNIGRILGNGYQAGALFKMQKIELIQYQATVAQYDAEDIIDGNSRTHSSFNIDVGVRKAFGEKQRFVYGMTVENLIPQEYEGPLGAVYHVDPVPVAALGYHSRWFKAEASTDLAKRAGFDLLDDRQYARVGLEVSAGRHFHVRAGYVEDLQGNLESLATVGLGVSPWDRANIDLAVQKGEGDTFGAALQLGFKI